MSSDSTIEPCVSSATCARACRARWSPNGSGTYAAAVACASTRALSSSTYESSTRVGLLSVRSSSVVPAARHSASRRDHSFGSSSWGTRREIFTAEEYESGTRLDVLVRREQIRRVPLRLDLGQPPEIVAVRRGDALAALFLGEEVDVGAAGREPAKIAPDVARPLDVRVVVFGFVPRGRDVQHPARIPVADGRVIRTVTPHDVAEREENESGMRRDQLTRVVGHLRHDLGLELRQVLRLPVVTTA